MSADSGREPRIAGALIGALLALYPQRFRAAFAAEMRDTFRDRYRDRTARLSRTRRLTVGLVLTFKTATNLLGSGISERFRSSFQTAPIGGRGRPPRRRRSLGDNALATVFSDLRIALRAMRRQPGFTAVVVLTLAGGIGANTTIFSLVNGVLLRPMPYDHPDELVRAWTSNVARGIDRWGVSLHDYEDWRSRNDVFADVAVYNVNWTNLSGLERPQRITYAQVTPSLFTTLRTDPLHGRTFTPDENLPGNDNVIVASYGFWMSSLGGDPNAIGSTLTVDGRPMTLVGIMPKKFSFPHPDVRIWKPFGMLPAQEGSRIGRWTSAVARLKPGIELVQAQASLDALGALLQQDYPETNEGFSIHIEPLKTTSVREVERTLLILWGCATFVLLIVCANLANLFLARATAREREIAVRAALGASKSRLIRQLIVETVPVALLGCGVGLSLAYWGLAFLQPWAADRIPRLSEVSLDIMPAYRASGVALHLSLKEGSKSSDGQTRNRTRGVLVVAQIALAVVVVTGAGLLVRSLTTLLNTDPGFESEHVLTMRLAPSWQEIPERETVALLYDEIRTELAAMPFVTSASAINRLPLSGRWWSATIEIEGRDQSPTGRDPVALTRVVLPHYHETMGIPLLKGRHIDDSDDANALDVAVINEAMADMYWPDEDPLGKRFSFGSPAWYTIVGISGNEQPADLADDPFPMFYLPFTQGSFGHFQDWGMSLVVRVEGDTQTAIVAVRQVVGAIAPTIPLHEIRTLEQLVGDDVAGQRFNTLLVGAFAAIALLLASMGVYSVMAYLVAQRTREIGIRIALGAAQSSVVGLVIARGMVLVAGGLAIGLVVSSWVGKLMSTMLYETSPIDPLTYLSVSAVLALAAVTACAVPAVRATRIDPQAALRVE
jgi:putative ABC transport system permease protein